MHKKMLVKKHEGKRPEEDNIKIDLKETGWMGVGWIHLAWVRQVEDL
jgi:hypothetical protein